MRVRGVLSASTAAATCLGTVLGFALGASPAGAAAAPAKPAPGTVTVTAVDSTGAPAEASFWMQPLGQGPLFAQGPATGTAAVETGPGAYAVSVDIAEPGRHTIGVAFVQVENGQDAAVSFDAGQGNAVSATISDDPEATVLTFLAGPVVDDGMLGGAQTRAGEALYVIPQADERASLHLQAVLDGGGSAARPIRYNVVHAAKGLPATLAYTDKRAAMARVDMTLGRPDRRELPTTVFLNPDAGPGIEFQLGKAATQVVSYRTAGTYWMAGMVGNNVTLLGPGKKYWAKQYAESWGQGIWGPPAGTAYADIIGSMVHASGGSQMCPAPVVPGQGCFIEDLTVSAQLLRAGKVLAKQTTLPGALGEDVMYARVGSTAQRFTYKSTTTRARPGALSSRVSSVWGFAAKAGGAEDYKSIPLIVVEYRPTGLDARVGAKPGSSTRLPIRVWGAFTVKTFTLEASTDDGRTWRPVAAKKLSGTDWQAAVKNPGRAGYVALRAKVTDSKGSSVLQTVMRAYRVG